jgi:hypothetical protein
MVGQRWIIACLMVGVIALSLPSDAEAWLYHASRRAAARRIMARGLDPAKFRASARYGPGFYASKRPSTALLEKGKGSSIVRFQESGYVKKNTWNFRKPSPGKIRSKVGEVDLRGKINNGSIGPKLGHQLGRAASQEGKVIQYKSSKNGWTNYFFPKRLFKDHPDVVKPNQVIK